MLFQHGPVYTHTDRSGTCSPEEAVKFYAGRQATVCSLALACLCNNSLLAMPLFFSPPFLCV